MKAYFDRWVDAHEAELLRDLSRLIAVRSVKGEAEPGKPFGAGPAAALSEAMAVCGELGFAVKNWDGYVATADAADAERGLDILCHLDVVGEGADWVTDPYTAVVKDGCVWGRGTDDDKGPAVAAMYAMRAVMESGVPMKRNVRLILGTDEESGSSDIAYYYGVKGEKPAPATFSPDNAFPVYNVEKGLYRQSFRKRFAPSGAVPAVTRLEGGYRFNVIPPDAWAQIVGLSDGEILAACEAPAREMGVTLTVRDGLVSVHGRSAHASLPSDGVNALTALIDLLCLLPLAESPSADALRQLNRLFPHGDFGGYAVGIAVSDEVSGDLTLAFSVLRMDEQGLEGTFDARTPVCAEKDTCYDVVHARMEPLGYQLEGEMIPSHCTPADTPFVQTLLRAYEQYTGLPGACIPSGGATYVHDIPGGVAFGASMPGVVTNLHGPNEHMPVKDLLTAAKIFAQVIYDLCC